MTHHQKIHLFTTLCLLIIIGGLALLGYWRFLDGTVINPVLDDISKAKYQTTKAAYEPGEEVAIISQHFCKYRNVPAKVYVTLVDTVMLNYPVEEVSTPAGCYDSRELLLKKLPLFLTPSHYHFEGYIEYQVNPLRTIIIPFSTTGFDVPEAKIIIK